MGRRWRLRPGPPVETKLLNLVYMAFTGLGCLYVLLAAFLGHASDAGGGHDAGAAAGAGGHAASGGDFAGHAGHGGHGDHAGPTAHGDHGGHADRAGHGDRAGNAAGHLAGHPAGHPAAHAGSPAAARFRFPLFSPLALATVVASIGAWGLIAKYGFGASDGGSLALALPAAALTAYGVTWAGWRLVSGSRATSLIYRDDLVGALAEVTVPIPPGGVGEAVTDAGGQRYAAPAREASGAEVARGATVVILEASGTTLLVRAEPRQLSISRTMQAAAPAPAVQDGLPAAPAAPVPQGENRHG
jgi:membrane protein implicated in regulation of membrane protease activity